MIKAAFLLLPWVLGAADSWPLTTPERTEFRRTSTVAEVKGFMEALRKRAPALQAYALSMLPTLRWAWPAAGSSS